MIKGEEAYELSYGAALEEVPRVIRKTLRSADNVFSGMTEHLAKKGGKNIRAALLLACAQNGEGKVPQNAVTAAAMLEILHLASLVHDDVIDEAPLRRGEASLHQLFGKRAAVLCGDYLFCRCFFMVSEITARYPGKFKDVSLAMTRICVGELTQFQHNFDYDLSLYQYLKIIAGKTAALFSLAMYAGGILGGETDKEARRMARIGFQIGMLFQIQDDCMDYRGDVKTAKKTVGHDLSDGVVTLPLILSIGKDPAFKNRLQGVLPPAEAARIVADVVSSGGVDMAWGIGERYYNKAQKGIGEISDPNRRAKLAELLNKIRTNAKEAASAFCQTR